MSLYNGPPRPGARGGRDQFNWENVKSDKDREFYLGHSVKAATGRWQKGKDLFWYTREKKDEATVEQEIQAVKAREQELMMEALGLKPKSVRSAGEAQLDRQELQQLLQRGASGGEERDPQQEEVAAVGLGYGARKAAVPLVGAVHEVMQGEGVGPAGALPPPQPQPAADPGAAAAAAGGGGSTAHGGSKRSAAELEELLRQQEKAAKRARKEAKKAQKELEKEHKHKKHKHKHKEHKHKEHKEDRHREGRHKEDRHREGRHKEDRHREGRHKEDRHREGRHKEDRHREGRHKEDRQVEELPRGERSPAGEAGRRGLPGAGRGDGPRDGHRGGRHREEQHVGDMPRGEQPRGGRPREEAYREQRRTYSD